MTQRPSESKDFNSSDENSCEIFSAQPILSQFEDDGSVDPRSENWKSGNFDTYLNIQNHS